MPGYLQMIDEVASMREGHDTWGAINPEYVVRMKLQNRFKTGLEIAQYTADIMRRDMANYDADSSKYTQSLGAWHGFIAQQTMMSVKKRQGTVDKRYIYLSGWMVAALRSEFGRLRFRQHRAHHPFPRRSPQRSSTHHRARTPPHPCWCRPGTCRS